MARLTNPDHQKLGFHSYIGEHNPYSEALTIGEFVLVDNTRGILMDVMSRLAAYEDLGTVEELRAMARDLLEHWEKVCNALGDEESEDDDEQIAYHHGFYQPMGKHIALLERMAKGAEQE